MISIDCEATGLDLRHGAKPFMVQICFEDGEQLLWRWDVNPVNRQPYVPKADLREIKGIIKNEDKIVGQNIKFDIRALSTLDPSIGATWPWERTLDTLLAGHLLASNQPHNLTDMFLAAEGVDIGPFEEEMHEACEKARRMVRSARMKAEKIEKKSEGGKAPLESLTPFLVLPIEKQAGSPPKNKRIAKPKPLVSLNKYEQELIHWRIAEVGLEDMPSAKETCWKADTWLPYAVAELMGYPEDHPWWTVTEKYANTDSASTLALWKWQWAEIKKRGLEKIYKGFCLKLIPVIYAIEERGITLSAARLSQQEQDYKEESERAANVCLSIAESLGFELTLPKGGVNDSLRTFMFDVLKVPPVRSKKAKTDAPTLNAEAMQYYLGILPENSKALTFVKRLLEKRSRDTAVTFMAGYRRFWKPIEEFNSSNNCDNCDGSNNCEWYRLYSSLNQTGTDTLRLSSNNPNQQNISKKEGFNLRYSFGPAPGREGWSLDYSNLELVLPAYYAGEMEMIDLFECPDKPPYFGSNHLLAAHTLHREKFEACKNDKGDIDGRVFKKKYASTLYQWTKNGNFAVQYGAIESSGTADRAYHVDGGQRMIQSRFKKIKELNDRCIKFAEKHGYVETMPDKTVDPAHGYPIMCTRTEYGRILPTTPLNYFIQSTACWVMLKSMIKTFEYLETLNLDMEPDRGYYIIANIHDEILLDFPKGEGEEPWKTNLAIVAKIQDFMIESGVEIGIPLRTSREYHPVSWDKGISV